MSKNHKTPVRTRHMSLEVLVYHHEDERQTRFTTRFSGAVMGHRDGVRLCALSQNYPVRKVKAPEVASDHAEVGDIVYNHRVSISARDRKIFSTLDDRTTRALIAAVYQSLCRAAAAPPEPPPDLPDTSTPPPAGSAA